MNRILVVQRNGNQRLLLEEELGHEGYEVEAVASAEEALARLPGVRPDLVLLDIHMPGMSGLELLGRLVRLDGRLPVVIYTGDESLRDNFLTWAADAYVVKRSDLGELKGTLRHVLAARPSRLDCSSPVVAGKAEDKRTRPSWA